MSKQSKFNIELVKLEDIVVTNATIQNPGNTNPINSNFEINFSFIPGLNLVEKKVRIILSCEIKLDARPNSNENISGKFDLAFYFQIENLEEIIKGADKEKGEIVIDKDATISLANITYSTARGIIFTKCQGTVLGKVIMPILSNEKITSIFEE